MPWRNANPTTWNSAWVEGGTPTAYSGYDLLNTTWDVKRWGQNKFSANAYLNMGDFIVNGVSYPLGNVRTLQMNFDQPGSANSMGDTEFQTAEGDSGGGLFVKDSNGNWNLSGILEAAGPGPGMGNQPYPGI